MSFDNTKIFSVGDDGVLGIFSLIDKEPRKKDAPQIPAIQISDKILIEKQRRDDLKIQNQKLDEEIDTLQKARIAEHQKNLSECQRQIDELDSQIKIQKAETDQQTAIVLAEKARIKEEGEAEIDHLKQLHQEELKLKKREHEEKMYADNERYQELFHQKQEQQDRFNQRISELHLIQEKDIKELRIKHQLEKEAKDDEIRRLQKQKELLQ